MAKGADEGREVVGGRQHLPRRSGFTTPRAPQFAKTNSRASTGKSDRDARQPHRESLFPSSSALHSAVAGLRIGGRKERNDGGLLDTRASAAFGVAWREQTPAQPMATRVTASKQRVERCWANIIPSDQPHKTSCPYPRRSLRCALVTMHIAAPVSICRDGAEDLARAVALYGVASISRSDCFLLLYTIPQSLVALLIHRCPVVSSAGRGWVN